MSVFKEEDWQSSEKERSRLVKDNGPKVDTTRLPQLSSTLDYPKNINVVPMGSLLSQTSEKSGDVAGAWTTVWNENKKSTDDSYRPSLTKFEQEVRKLINSECMEQRSNTPDFILAEYLSSCLNSFNVATRQREQWYGRKVF